MRPPTTIDALLVAAVFSRHAEAFAWAKSRLSNLWGPVALESDPFSFAYTSYYTKAMGSDINKQLIAFERVVPLASLAEHKLQAIAIEQELAASGRFAEERPINIDPGVLTLGKFMLATTKDQAHRIYLGKKIFAEVTLRLRMANLCRGHGPTPTTASRSFAIFSTAPANSTSRA